jgi:hypothetical protein
MAEPGTLIAIEGASAAGKTTLVRAAGRRLGWLPVPEAIDRLVPPPSIDFGSPEELLALEETLLAEESRRYLEARQRCAVGRTVVADTGFLGPVTYTHGLFELGRAPASVTRSIDRSARALMRNGGLGIPDLTVYLATTHRERAEHVRKDAPRRPVALQSRHEAVGAVERRYFETEFPRALPGRFRVLRGSATPASRLSALRALVARAEPAPAVQWEGLRLLACLRPAVPGRRGRNVGPNR